MRTSGLGTTFLFLCNRYGPTMRLEEVRDVFFPGLSLKTMQNKASAGLLPTRIGLVFDTYQVAEWWEKQTDSRERRA